MTQCILLPTSVKTDKDGYPYFGNKMYAYRLVYMLTVGPIAPGYEIDHLCRNKLCVNPRHLEAVTHSENMRRWHAQKTHCNYGHEWIPKNIYTAPTSGKRQCRICRDNRSKSHRRRKD